MGVVDVEGEARWLLRDQEDVPGARALVRRHLGPDSIRIVPRRALPMPGAFARVHGRPRVYLRSGLSPIEQRWTLCHELAEWHLGQVGYREPDVELVAESLAAALVLPREPFRHAARRSTIAELADDFGATQTAVALRLGEVQHVECAVVVRPGLVRVRAPESFVVPPEPALRRAARDGHEQLERHPLTDDRRRVALFAAA